MLIRWVISCPVSLQPIGCEDWELLLILVWWSGVLRSHPSVLPWRVRLLLPKRQWEREELHTGVQQSRVCVCVCDTSSYTVHTPKTENQASRNIKLLFGIKTFRWFILPCVTTSSLKDTRKETEEKKHTLILWTWWPSNASSASVAENLTMVW